jgi:hypothetical protein
MIIEWEDEKASLQTSFQKVPQIKAAKFVFPTARLHKLELSPEMTRIW